VSWTQGISPNEFNKSKVKDIREIMEIHEAIGQKGMREAQIKNMMSKVMYKGGY
jgi:hypothetical protein